jgi:hypothetical protein
MDVMSIVIKNKKYAYLAYRSGERVAQKYLGLLSDPAVAEKVKELQREKTIPDEFRYLFWDTSTAEIDPKKNARYIIERVLEMGGLDALQWIQRLYPTRLIVETLETSRKVSPRSKNFWTIWFGKGHAF